MPNLRLLAVVPLAALLIWPSHKPSNTSASIPTNGLRQTDAIIVPSEMPLTVVSARVDSEEGRQLSILEYTVRNNSSQTIKRFALGAYLVANNNGKCLRGEVWTVKEDLRPNATKQFSTTLRNYVDLNGRLAVAFVSAADQATETKADLPELRKTLKQVASTDTIASSDLQAVGVNTNAVPPSPDSCDAAFCTTARQDALQTCLGEGCQLTTFSCNRTACSYSFGCRCCTDGHCN